MLLYSYQISLSIVLVGRTHRARFRKEAYVVSMPYEVHQRELWMRICQIMHNRPEVLEWTPKMLSDALGISVGSPGFERILEVLHQADLAQEPERPRIKPGFV